MELIQDRFAQEVLWGIENARLLSTEEKLRFLNALKDGRLDEIRDELADAMEAEALRVNDDIDTLNRNAMSFIQSQMREIEQRMAMQRPRPLLQRLFGWMFTLPSPLPFDHRSCAARGIGRNHRSMISPPQHDSRHS